MPADLDLAEFTFGQKRYDLEEVSDSNGYAAARLMAPPRWTIGMRSPRSMKIAAASKWEVFLIPLRGRVNHLEAWDVMRTAPQGTMRGSLVLAADVAAGATSMTLLGAVGTLAAADLLQIGSGLGSSQLVKVMGAVSATVLTSAAQTWTDGAANNQAWTDGAGHAQTWSASGTAVVSFEAPTRRAYTRGTVVTWDKPRAYFKAVTESVDWGYASGGPFEGGFAQDFIEAFQ